MSSSSSEALRASIRKAIQLNDGDIEISKLDPKGRRIPPSRGVHLRGFHPVRVGHPQICFESKLERNFISGMAAVSELHSIRSQPITVHYRWRGQARSYTPDFSVSLAGIPEVLRRLHFDHQTYIEIKPLSKAEALRDELIIKFRALRAATSMEVLLLTEFEVLAIAAMEVGHVA